ncbi:piezo-type mechanosensitive ion channel component 2-like [Notothenia coriiceps]|uniref:Piezo-type mechanosensitive ion channel component 2-like n=1 Tax=Notothenia coriiceps TaxID=8208 RepID=A0A6I9N3M8_9TELE|nr:PREDICTED: piezo-type mechanosensitive ion channel component 2-like [Notothenia coriiceps]
MFTHHNYESTHVSPLLHLLSLILSALQFLYHAWITDPKAALRARAKEKRKFWKKYTKVVRRKKNKKKDAGHVTIDLGELSDGQDKREEENPNGPDNIIKRVFNILKFTFVLFQTTVDSFTQWMNDMCREYIDISTVLRIERCMLSREVKKGNVPSKDSIHVLYQKAMKLNMSRQASLDQLSEDDSASASTRLRRRRRPYPMESQDSTASRDSISSGYTEATNLFSRQSTLEDLDGMPECIPKTSERARPKLRKMYGLDASTSSVDSCSSFMSSEATQVVMLYSRQGTTDTIEEVEDEHDQGEDKQQAAPWESQQLDESEGAEGGGWSDADPRDQKEEEEEEEEEEEGEEGMEVPKEQEREKKAPWDSLGPDEGPSLRVKETESAQEKDFTTDSEEGAGQPGFTPTEGRVGLIYTPDTDASKTSDAEIPPSYSKAVSFDRLELSDDESDMDRKRGGRMLMTSDSRSDSRSDLMLPSMTTELTASELLLNK